VTASSGACPNLSTSGGCIKVKSSAIDNQER